MVRESREDLVVDPVDPTVGTIVIGSDDRVSIPDNDPAGAIDTVTVEDAITIKRVAIDLEIRHTYRGDLIVELQHGSTIVNVYNGNSASEPWADDVVIEGRQIDGFAGSDASGDWTIKVVDSFGQDVGNMVSWTLTIE